MTPTPSRYAPRPGSSYGTQAIIAFALWAIVGCCGMPVMWIGGVFAYDKTGGELTPSIDAGGTAIILLFVLVEALLLVWSIIAAVRWSNARHQP